MRSIITTCDWRSAASKSRSISMPGTGLGGELGQQLFGSAEQHARAQARQQQHVGAGDAAVQDVADDGDGDAGRRRFGVDAARDAGAQVGEDGAQVEQRLGGMLVHAVAGVEDGQAGLGFKQPGRAGGVVAQDDGFGAEGAQGQAGVFERLALFNAGQRLETSVVSAPRAFGGQLKAGAGAGGGLVKEQRDAALGRMRARS